MWRIDQKKRTLKRNFKSFLLSENDYTTYQNVWSAVKAVLRGKFITLNAYIIKKERLKFIIAPPPRMKSKVNQPKQQYLFQKHFLS